MRTAKNVAVNIVAAVALIGGIGCDVPAPDEVESTAVEGVDVTAGELALLTAQPTPEPDEELIEASAETTADSGIGFYAISRAKKRIRAFSTDGARVIATFSGRRQPQNQGRAENLEIVYLVGTKKVAVKAQIDRSGQVTTWDGDANGRRFRFAISGNGDAIDGSRFRLVGPMAIATRHVALDLREKLKSQGLLCEIADHIVHEPEIAIVEPEIWLGIALGALIFC